MLDRNQQEAQLLASLNDWQTPQRQQLDQLTAVHPSSFRVWLSRAIQLQHRSAQDAERRQAVEQAMLLAPHHPYSWLLRAYLEADHGRFSSARESAERAHRLQPTNSDLLWSEAKLFAQLGACNELQTVSNTLRQAEHARLEANQLEYLERLKNRCAEAEDSLQAAN